MDAVRSMFRYKTFENDKEDKNQNEKDKDGGAERRKNGAKRRLEGRFPCFVIDKVV